MPDLELPPFIYIENESEWQRCLETLSTASQLAIDLESNSMYVYREEICLIQISTPEQDYIIDPLAEIDLSPLGNLLADRAIEKIFHAVEYDLILMRRQFNWTLNNLFDTMWAARILGYDRVGLANMLNDLFDIELDKRFQRADWGKRPLSAEQLTYAQRDTHYLFRLREKLGQELAAGNHQAEAAEIFEMQTQIDPPDDQFDPNRFWSLNGVSDLSRQEKSIAHALYLYRHEIAKSLNRPLYKIIGDKVLLRMAWEQPRSVQDLYQMKGLGNWLVRRYGREIISVMNKARRSDPPRRPRQPRRPAQAILDRYETLHQWRKERARARGVESDVVMSKEALWHLARENPATLNELTAHEAVIGHWRTQTYGPEIVRLLNGRH